MRASSDVVVEPWYKPAIAYDLAAPYYDAWKWQAFWRQVELPTIMTALGERYGGRRRPRLADIGCGTGWYLQKLRPMCSDVVGVDISSAMLAQAAMRLPDVEFLEADVQQLPFDDGAFDIVLSTRVLSHVNDIGRALSELTRVVGAGGVMILTNVDALHAYGDTRLPMRNGHIQVETFKHARATINALLLNSGLVHRRSELITAGRETRTIASLAEVAGASAVGWISVWDRGLKREER